MHEIFTDFYEQERQARKEGNVDKLKEIFTQMIKLCKSNQEIISLIKILSVRRGQNIEAIKWLINEIYIVKQLDTNFIKLLLSEVIEGKIFLENERVVYTTFLKNKINNARDALNIVLNVPIETFTSVDESIRLKYQLEQFRLCLEVQDWNQASLVVKRIRQKYFEESNNFEDKNLFYKLQVQLYVGQKKFSEACKTLLKFNESFNKMEYSVISSFYCLCITLNEGINKNVQCTILYNDKNNKKSMRRILNMFISDILISKEIINDIGDIMEEYMNIDSYKFILEQAIDEHNYKIVEKFYSTLNLNTFSTLLCLQKNKLIELISYMVNNNHSKCKINQKERMVSFGLKNGNDTVDDILNKLIEVDHLIHKERLKCGK